MFEDTLLDSPHVAGKQNRWATVTSLALQLSLAAALLAIPVFHPEHLALAVPALTFAIPPTPPPPTPPVRVHVQPTTEASSPATPSAPSTPQTSAPVLNLHPTTIQPEGDVSVLAAMRTPGGDGIPTGLNEIASGNSFVSVTPLPPAHPTIARVSQGVAAGMLIAPIHPVYPSIARNAHVEGTVVIHAIIARSGDIESATVISGPVLLAQAALDAVRAAQYRPYRLNGDPVEVDTTINIIFHMNE